MSKNRRPKEVQQYEHKGKERPNNPPVGLVTLNTEPAIQEKKQYKYDPHLDPQLQWAGKAEHSSFEVDTVSLHVHERIDPMSIIESVRGGGGGVGLLVNYPYLTLTKNPFAKPLSSISIKTTGATA